MAQAKSVHLRASGSLRGASPSFPLGWHPPASRMEMCSLTPEVLPLAGSPGADAVLEPHQLRGASRSQPLLALCPTAQLSLLRTQPRRQGTPTHVYASPPGWHLSSPALGSFLSISFIKVVAFLMDCHLAPPPPQSRSLLAGDWKYVLCKRKKTLHLFTFVTLCPGDELGEEVLGRSQPYVAMWASVGLVPQRRPQDKESSVLSHEPHPTPWFNKHYKESSSCHHLTSIH